MPKISSYGTVTPSPSDRIIVSDANDSNATKNVTVSSLTATASPANFINAFNNGSTSTDITLTGTPTWDAVTAPLTLETGDGLIVDISNNYKITNNTAVTLTCSIQGTVTVTGPTNAELMVSFNVGGGTIFGAESDITLSNASRPGEASIISIKNIAPAESVYMQFKGVTGDIISVSHLSLVVISL
jgi:hypothetical protein